MSVVRVVVDTSYHQVVLAPLEVFAVVAMDPEQQLIALNDSGNALVVALGVRDGKVEISVTPDPDEDWGPVEDEAETVLDVTGELWLTSPTVENDLDEVFVPARPGSHHVRIRARGRRDNYDLSVEGEEAVEWYQIALWPVG